MKKILLIITMIMSMSTITRATITVTNVDTTLGLFGNGIYPLDLDNDGTADYLLRVSSISAGSQLDIVMAGSNSAVQSTNSSTPIVIPLDSGDAFFPWTISSTNSYFYHPIDFNTSPSDGIKYTGLRLTKNGDFYYGWLRFDVGFMGFSIDLFDYAFEDLPNTLITAGQTVSIPTGVDQLEEEKTFSFYPNPAKDVVHLTGLENQQVNAIKIYTIDGQLMKEYEEQNKSINISGLTKGFYILEIIADNRRRVKKIIKH